MRNLSLGVTLLQSLLLVSARTPLKSRIRTLLQVVPSIRCNPTDSGTSCTLSQAWNTAGFGGGTDMTSEVITPDSTFGTGPGVIVKGGSYVNVTGEDQIQQMKTEVVPVAASIANATTFSVNQTVGATTSTFDSSGRNLVGSQKMELKGSVHNPTEAPAQGNLPMAAGVGAISTLKNGSNYVSIGSGLASTGPYVNFPEGK
eukprot:jgi/Botrbrau1/2592/Bobra.145_1s0019.1